MSTNFSNRKNQESTPKIQRIKESKEQKYSNIKKNILELIFDNNAKKQFKRNNHSETNSKYQRIYLYKKINKNKEKENKKISHKNILKEESNNDANDFNLSIKEDEKPIIKYDNLEESVQQKNKELKDKEISNKEKSINEKKKSNKSQKANKRTSKVSKDFNEKKINNNITLLNVNDKSLNNDILNINNIYSSNELSSNNNSNHKNYYSNNNANNINYAFNFFGINNQEDNSSLNSSKNEISSKNIKLNNNNQNRISNKSNSSLGKNFVLKSEICKSTFHNENRFYKNSSCEDNPIMTYYRKDIKRKNFGNFYLFTDRKSVEEPDQNQYINFFPMNDNNNKKKEKNIISCNYIDNNNDNEIPEKINTDIINENCEYSPKYNFTLNEFHQTTNKEDKLNLEKLIKNLGNKNTNDKSKIDTFFEYDNDINGKINEFIDNEKINQENTNNNSNNNNLNEKKKFEIPLNKNINNKINIDKNEFINTDNNLKNAQYPLSFINNVYNINNSNYKQYQMNPIINSGIPNYFYNQNMNINLPMNYFDSNFYKYYYQQINNQKNDKFQNPYFKSINNINKNNGNNNINSNENNKVETIQNNNNNINNNNNLNGNNKIYNDIQTNNISNNIYNQNIFNNINKNKINNIDGNNYNKINFKNKNFFELSDEEILNSATQIINDQLGCRFMQEKIKSNHNFANELLFPKIKYHLKEISNDCFGNYFLQVLIDILSFDNINKFFDMTQKDFTDICISPHGTRVIQKIIDKIAATPILMNRFIYNLNSKDLGIIFKSPYGNHMIQKFLVTNHTSEYSNFIFYYIYKNFLDIADSKHGVCVIQKCVSEGDEKQRAKLYELILNNFNILIKGRFGNYLIQYILNNTKSEEQFKEIMPIILKIEGNIIDFCKSRFSANVIEKLFENSEYMISEHILDSLLNNNSEHIIDILLDQYGIYVIQKALKIKNLVYKNKLIETIKSKEKELKNINFSDNKYKNILKIIITHKELGEIIGKNIQTNYISNNNEKIINDKIMIIIIAIIIKKKRVEIIFIIIMAEEKTKKEKNIIEEIIMGIKLKSVYKI